MPTEFQFRSQSNAENFYRAKAKSWGNNVSLDGLNVVIEEDELDIVHCLSEIGLLDASSHIEFHLWNSERADVIIQAEHVPQTSRPTTEHDNEGVEVIDRWVNALRSEHQNDRLKAIKAIESHPKELPLGVDALLPVLVKALENPDLTQHAGQAIIKIGEREAASVRKYLNEIERLQQQGNALVASQASKLVEKFSDVEENSSRSNQEDVSRDTIQQKRYLRSDQFREKVREAYNNRCVVCGKRRFSPSGNPEVEAGHIKPVQDGGPDSIQNGAAFCKLHHWAFDTGWISFTDDYEVTVLDAPDTLGYDDFAKFDGQSLHLPELATKYPDRNYLQFHRQKYGFD